jgi:large subunit ribosomal protein L10
MNRDQKAAVIDEIAGEIAGSEAIFAVDYRGLSVAQAADLRARLRESDTHFRVVKNSLSERAADKAGADSLKPLLVGPTALALVRGDAALAAKALNDAARATNVLDFKGGLMNGAALTADDVRAIARLPSRDVLTAQLVGTIAAPLSGLVRTLNALIAGVAIQLKAIADQGLVGGGAAAEAPAAEAPAAEAPAAEAPAAEAPAAEPEAPAAEPEAPAAEPEAPAAEPEAPAAEAPAAEPEAEAPAAEAEPDTPASEPEPEQPEPDTAGEAEQSEA